MCLTIYKELTVQTIMAKKVYKYPPKKTAEEDITVWKIVRCAFKGKKIKYYIPQVYSKKIKYYRGRLYKDKLAFSDTTYWSDLWPRNRSKDINRAFHCYKTEPDYKHGPVIPLISSSSGGLRNYCGKNDYIVKCKIPKGAKYYESGNMIASNQIILLNRKLRKRI